MDIDNNNQETHHQKQGRIFLAITKYLALAWLAYALVAITAGWTYYRTSFIPPLMFALLLWRPKPASYVFMMSAIIAFIGEQLFYILTVFSPMRIFALLTLYVPYHLGIALILGIVAAFDNPAIDPSIIRIESKTAVSLKTAKRFALSLAGLIQRYEATSGVIDVAAPQVGNGGG